MTQQAVANTKATVSGSKHNNEGSPQQKWRRQRGHGGTGGTTAPLGCGWKGLHVHLSVFPLSGYLWLMWALAASFQKWNFRAILHCWVSPPHLGSEHIGTLAHWHLFKANQEVCITKIKSHIWHISVAFHKAETQQRKCGGRISYVLVGGFWMRRETN